jgi:hypothetical protein
MGERGIRIKKYLPLIGGQGTEWVKVKSPLGKFDSFVKLDVLTVRSTARHTLHLQFNISANAFEIRAVQSL